MYYNFEGHPLHPGEGVPLFIAAGPLKEAQDLARFELVDDPLVVPVLTSGGWTKSEWPGNATSENPTDFVYYPDRQMAGNARELPSSGLEGMRKLAEPIKRLSDKGIKTIIQVTNLPHETAIDVIPEMVEEAAAQHPTAVEIDLSCPNGLDEHSGKPRQPTCNDPEASQKIMQESRRRVGYDVVLGAKDSSHATSLESGIDTRAIRNLLTAIDLYIDFLTGINTIGGQPFPEIICAGGKGGMSGPVIAPIARDWLRFAREFLHPNVPILSCGGVDSANAGTEIPRRLKMGAMLVGGAQEFFRSPRPDILSLRWSQAYADSVLT